MVAKYIRKNKRRLNVFLDEEVHEFIKRRAEFKNITLSKWILQAITKMIEEENKYL